MTHPNASTNRHSSATSIMQTSDGEMYGIERVILERITLAIEQNVSGMLIRSRVQWLPEELSRMFRIQLRGHLWGERAKSTIIRTPKTWWDHLKLEMTHWTVAWIPRTWPVEYDCYDIRFTVMYPDFRPSVPEERHVIEMLVMPPLDTRATFPRR